MLLFLPSTAKDDNPKLEFKKAGADSFLDFSEKFRLIIIQSQLFQVNVRKSRQDPFHQITYK